MATLRRPLTIRFLMLAIAFMSVPFALVARYEMIIAVFAVPFISPILAWWLTQRGYRPVVAAGFWSLAVTGNGLYIATICVIPSHVLLILLHIAWVVLVLPTIGAFGVAWAILVSREDAAPWRYAPKSWLAVAVLSAFPLVTAVTVWPLRLAFLGTRSSLEALADRVAEGQSISYPHRVGTINLAGSAVDRATGSVALMIDPNPNHPRGFVRVQPGITEESRFRLIRGDELQINLGGGWWLLEED